jgi:hypothetical protein
MTQRNGSSTTPTGSRARSARVSNRRGPLNASRNTASDSATVAMQGTTVHGDVSIYQVPPGASAEQLFEIGVRYLDGGMPSKARQLFDEAIAQGHLTSEVHFHWLLALFSGRTLQQIPEEDLLRLKTLEQQFVHDSDDAWTAGINVIRRQVEWSNASEAERQVVLKEF